LGPDALTPRKRQKEGGKFGKGFIRRPIDERWKLESLEHAKKERAPNLRSVRYKKKPFTYYGLRNEKGRKSKKKRGKIVIGKNTC